MDHTRFSEVPEDVLVLTVGLLQGIGQDQQPGRVQCQSIGTGRVLGDRLLVGSLSQRQNQPCSARSLSEN